MSEWFEQPWPCGHNDPIYRGSAAQECAVCGEIRFDPEMSPPDTRFEQAEAAYALKQVTIYEPLRRSAWSWWFKANQ